MNDNLEGQLTILKSQLAELAISIGDIIMPVLREMVKGLQGIVDWLNHLSPATKEIIVKIGAVVAAAGPLLIWVARSRRASEASWSLPRSWSRHSARYPRS